jgi:TRAP-type C4-dicarboxylate transport system permease small subunit
LRGNHIYVDAFTNKFPRRVRRILNLITNLFTIIICFMLGITAFDLVAYSKNVGVTFSMLGVAEWPFYMIFAVSFIISALAFVVLAVRDWIADARGKEGAKS